MPLKAKMYIALIAASGLAALCFAVYPWESQNLMRFGFCLALALIGSGSKVRLPGITGTLSVYFLFVLLSIVELQLPETMVIVAAATLLQCYWQGEKPAKRGPGRLQHNKQFPRGRRGASDVSKRLGDLLFTRNSRETGTRGHRFLCHQHSDRRKVSET